MLVLNEVGTQVALLDEGLAPARIVARLAAEFDADPGRLTIDVAGFVAEPRAAGVIEEETLMELPGAAGQGGQWQHPIFRAAGIDLPLQS